MTSGDNIHVLTAEPLGEDIIKRLDEMRKLALRGELSSIAIVAVNRDGCTLQVWSQAPSLGLLLGSAQMLVYRLSQRLTGDAP